MTSEATMLAAHLWPVVVRHQHQQPNPHGRTCWGPSTRRRRRRHSSDLQGHLLIPRDLPIVRGRIVPLSNRILSIYIFTSDVTLAGEQAGVGVVQPRSVRRPEDHTLASTHATTFTALVTTKTQLYCNVCKRFRRVPVCVLYVCRSCRPGRWGIYEAAAPHSNVPSLCT